MGRISGNWVNDTGALERAFQRQQRQASAGIDGMTVAMYAQDLPAYFMSHAPRE